jgi:hypothetical protein
LLQRRVELGQLERDYAARRVRAWPARLANESPGRLVERQVAATRLVDPPEVQDGEQAVEPRGSRTTTGPIETSHKRRIEAQRIQRLSRLRDPREPVSTARHEEGG